MHQVSLLCISSRHENHLIQKQRGCQMSVNCETRYSKFLHTAKQPRQPIMFLLDMKSLDLEVLELYCINLTSSCRCLCLHGPPVPITVCMGLHDIMVYSADVRHSHTRLKKVSQLHSLSYSFVFSNISIFYLTTREFDDDLENYKDMNDEKLMIPFCFCNQHFYNRIGLALQIFINYVIISPFPTQYQQAYGSSLSHMHQDF